jgi:hypothetical protein
MSKSKIKGSSGFFNILLIVLGLIFIFKAVLDILSGFGIPLPDILDTLGGAMGAEELSLFSSTSFFSILLSLWCIVAGVGLFKEAEWAMGIALVVLSLMVTITVTTVFIWFINLFDPAVVDFKNIGTYIIIIAFCIGLFGFIYLLITRKRYD